MPNHLHSAQNELAALDSSLRPEPVRPEPPGQASPFMMKGHAFITNFGGVFRILFLGAVLLIGGIIVLSATKAMTVVVPAALVLAALGLVVPSFISSYLKKKCGAQRDYESELAGFDEDHAAWDAEKAELEIKRETIQARVAQAAKEAEIQIAADEVREGELQRIVGMGMREHDITALLAGIAHNGLGDQSLATQVAARIIEGESDGIGSIIARAHQTANELALTPRADGAGKVRGIGSSLFSFSFSDELPALGHTNSESFCEELSIALGDAAMLHINGGVAPDAKLRDDFRMNIKIEAWLSDVIDKDNYYWLQKPVPAPDEPVAYVIAFDRDAADANAEVRSFNNWIIGRSGSYVAQPTSHLLIPEDGIFIAGPRSRAATALIDLYSDESFKDTIGGLHGNPDAQRRLGIRVIRQSESFLRPTDIFTGNFKGSISFVGWWDHKDQFHEAENPVTSRLSAAAPNILIQGIHSIAQHTEREENRLLGELANFDEFRFDFAVSTNGNFIIRRGQLEDGGRNYGFFIRPTAEGKTVTKFFGRQLGGGGSRHDLSEGYNEFDFSNSPRSALERDGYLRIPYSDCYIMTGGDQVKLCLRLDTGSPAVGENSEGIYQFDEVNFPATLRNFAAAVGAEDYEEIADKKAQGVVARVNWQSPSSTELRPHFLKLIEPLHTQQFKTGGLVKKLVTAGVVPSSVSVHSVNTRGMLDDGAIRVFATPELPNIADAVAVPEGQVPDPARALAVCGRLLDFARACEAAEIYCTDWVLGDTGYLGGDPRDGQVFVFDYGSYISAGDLRRETKIGRLEYQAPEDWITSFAYEGGPLQTYVLGILFMEVLAGQPGGIPVSVSGQRSFAMADHYTTALAEEVAAVLGQVYPESVIELITSMLSYSPSDRPSLNEIRIPVV